MHTYIYIYIYIHIYLVGLLPGWGPVRYKRACLIFSVCIYIYIYRERERERDRYVYMYTHTYTYNVMYVDLGSILLLLSRSEVVINMDSWGIRM